MEPPTRTPVLRLTNQTEIVRLVKMINTSLLVKLTACSAAYIKISSVMVTPGVTMQRMRICRFLTVLTN